MSLFSWYILAASAAPDHLSTSDMELGERTFTRQGLEAGGQEHMFYLLIHKLVPHVACDAPHWHQRRREKFMYSTEDRPSS